MDIVEQIHRQDLERLKSLRYMDDDFMAVCLTDNFEGVELKKARYFKQDEKGVAAMCKIMEDMRNEAVQNKAKKNGGLLNKIRQDVLRRNSRSYGVIS